MLLNRFLIIFFIFGTGFYSSAQNYIDYLNAANEAEHEFVEGNLDSAKKIFAALEKKYNKLKGKDYFYTGLIYYFQLDTVSGKEYLIKSAETRLLLTNDLSKFRSKFPELNISESTIQHIKLIEKRKIPAKEYEISDSIKAFIRLDQEDRTVPGNFDEKKDFLVQKRLLNFLQRYGMPDPYIQGEEIYTIILHVSDTMLYRLYTSYLYKELVNGNVSPMYYCALVDRTMYRNNKQTKYLSYYPSKEIPNLSKDEILENRKKIGLSPYYQGTCVFPRIRTK
ncbi:MAG: hypothetical protein JNJ41_05960 [Bacteroidia bacterium]|nr:hypothetical protein [Bacteroidia bacterium]